MTTVSGHAPMAASSTAIDQLAGKQARRFLRVGEPVRAADVRAPILVTKGSTVTMTFHAPGISADRRRQGHERRRHWANR